MKIKYYPQIKSEMILAGVRRLLIKCDQEFVPPLSARNSTTQSNLAPAQASGRIPEEYFQAIASQSMIVAIADEKVVGFMSFRENYVCEHISKGNIPNVYITTVIVHPDYRHKGIAGVLYAKLLKLFKRYCIFTRTWSTNISHTRILVSLGFHEHCYLDNDRGEGIDTVYYRLPPRGNSIRQYVEQYHLGGNIFFFALLSVITFAFVMAWIYSADGIFHELSLAIATSLMASILCLLSDTYLKIRESKNDKFIGRLKNFGIENLQFNKNELLESIIPHCREEIWISGCRLIMTSKASFRRAMVLACKRSDNMHIKLLATPPWSTAYQLTYGKENVTMNYIKIIKDLTECTKLYNLDFQVHFSEKPLFSDTYKVDDRFVTGPYLHCSDRYNNRITAKDFFSLDITDPQTDLYKIIYSDYMTLWEESTAALDLQRFEQEMRLIGDPEKLTEEARTAMLLRCCEPLTARERQTVN